MQYLYLVPHKDKFKLTGTHRVLHQSAMHISDFDPREASLSFECLARYAHNLLDQPWRKDFLVINVIICLIIFYFLFVKLLHIVSIMNCKKMLVPVVVLGILCPQHRGAATACP